MARRAVSALLLTVLALGCSRGPDRVRASEAEKVLDELQRIEKTLPAEKAAEFRQAYQTLLAIVLMEAQDNEAAAKAALMRRFNGKTASQIVSDYDALDASARTQFAAGIAEGQKRAQAPKPKLGPAP